jgi:hypothetical protein
LAKRPLTSREIVNTAYHHDLIPPKLYGKTQHKTFGARLSEDILARREQSLFYRSEPGRFFLREFLSDNSIPQDYRRPIIARRRQRELRRGSALTVSRSEVVAANNSVDKANDSIGAIIEGCHFRYSDPVRKGRRPDDLYIWSFVMFMRGLEVLTYRHGRYREGRDSFLKRRSVGFFTPVVDADRDLFDIGGHGIISSGVRGVVVDLDLPASVAYGDSARSATIADMVIATEADGAGDLLAVVRFECPDDFEPMARRLAINDLHWARLDVPFNHLEDFDPWSQLVVARAQTTWARSGGY